MRIAYYLTDQQVPFETLLHPPAFTATKRARVLRVPGKLLAKCVLLAVPRSYVLAVVPATHQVDLAAVAAALGGTVRLARCDEIPEVFRDCEWGGLVPFGTLYGLPTLLDQSFDGDDLLVFEAQRHAQAIRMRCCDFERLEKPHRLALSRPSTSGS